MQLDTKEAEELLEEILQWMYGNDGNFLKLMDKIEKALGRPPLPPNAAAVRKYFLSRRSPVHPLDLED